MEQPLFYGQWLIENGLNRGVGSGEPLCCRWLCKKDVPSGGALDEDDHDGQCRNDEHKLNQKPFETHHRLTRRRLVAQFGDTPIQLSDVSIYPGDFVWHFKAHDTFLQKVEPLDDQHLLPELGERVAQRSTGNLHQPFEWAVQLFDQKDRAGDRQRADEQGR
jgi:hypothetical protein